MIKSKFIFTEIKLVDKLDACDITQCNIHKRVPVNADSITHSVAHMLDSNSQLQCNCMQWLTRIKFF